MAGGRKRGRTQRRHFKQSRENVWKYGNKEARPDDPSADVESNPTWQPFATQNLNFEEYYKEQHIVPEDEWEEFICILRKPLPAAFRINSSGQFCKDIMLQLENDFITSLKDEVNDEQEMEAIRPLPWYPGNLAWHSNFSRMQLRKNQTLERFHEFLKQENEVGNITRQEAVSMVPPLFLDVLPEHHMLDMCAAPGSKTFQLLEMIHQSSEPGLLPNGLVIANDVDVQRCNLLIHQTKRMCTSNLVVTNHEAQHFPTCYSLKDHKEIFRGEEFKKSNLQFDRVLCDVPCSGDGTLRKAPDIWRKWNAGMGNGLHRLQVEIAMRGVALLKVGGRMVYSTCSMNPVENEAVVAEVLRRSGDSIKLLDVSNELPGLVRRPGLRTWKVKDRGIWLASYKHVPKYRRNVILPSMFPSGKIYEEILVNDALEEHTEIPGSNSAEENVCNDRITHPEYLCLQPQTTCEDLEKNAPLTCSSRTENKLEKISSESVSAKTLDGNFIEEISGFPLENCMRIVPHDQNSGAFFIAVFEKLSPLQVGLSTESRHCSSANITENLENKSKEEMHVPNDVHDENVSNASLATSDVDMTGNQSTEISGNDAVSVCSKDNDLQGAGISYGEESAPTDIKEVKGKFQSKGKWRGIDPVVFFKNQTIIDSIKLFYGISESFLLDGHLVTRNSDPNHVKRIYYISKSVKDILELNVQIGERLKITSVGLKIFERQKSNDTSTLCSFRLSSEGLPLLLPYITKQILCAPLGDFQQLLQKRTVKFADFIDAGFREKASSLMPGCCVIVLNEGEDTIDSITVDASTIAIICWKGKTNLGILLSPSDGQELLERVALRFGIQISTLSVAEENAEIEIDEAGRTNASSAKECEEIDEEVAFT